MIIYYRISNNSNNILRLPNSTKENCLLNALKHFEPFVDQFNIIADNVTEESLHQFLLDIKDKHNKVTLEETKLGNAGSFWYIFSKALELPESTRIYFLEDDYIHKNNSYKILQEGLNRGDYATLYDHNDMYKNHSEGGDNPFIEDGGEITRVILTENSHFKTTISTTLTFATTVNVLKEDFDIWKTYTGGVGVSDFYSFVKLREKGRSLLVPIPGYSTHACIGYLSPLHDWDEEVLK
jgi:hypothetical protein